MRIREYSQGPGGLAGYASEVSLGVETHMSCCAVLCCAVLCCALWCCVVWCGVAAANRRRACSPQLSQYLRGDGGSGSGSEGGAGRVFELDSFGGLSLSSGSSSSSNSDSSSSDSSSGSSNSSGSDESFPLPLYIFDNKVLGSHTSARQSHVEPFSRLFGGGGGGGAAQQAFQRALQSVLSAVSAGELVYCAVLCCARLCPPVDDVPQCMECL
jgi:hypothetical protein